tara:strand:- start:184 stop:405 length:222 start_codon:yes stop_codon:yes gene_type:complete
MFKADIIYEVSETTYTEKIESLTLEDLVSKAMAFLKAYRDWNPHILSARMFIGEEKILIKQKVIDLINRRKNG